MLITGARVALNAREAIRRDLWIQNGRISFLRLPDAEDTRIDLEGHLILPGLINAHDHLELNLFPNLGRGPYPNAAAWAKDIHHPLDPPVRQQLAVPKPLRLFWGGIKNLLSGVTVVAHHNNLHASLLTKRFPVRVIRKYGWAHSIDFCADWSGSFARTPKSYPFVMHAAEGTDAYAARETQTLAAAKVLNHRTVLVHAVGIPCTDVRLLEETGTSVVWCPTSNAFTLHASLADAILESRIPVALGTDSAMTASGDLREEMQMASQRVTPERLYQMVTTAAARIFRLPPGFGEVCHNGPADLLVVPDINKTPACTLLTELPELVMVRGFIRLTRNRPGLPTLSPHSITVEHRGRYRMPYPLGELIRQTETCLEEPMRLAGKRIAA